MSSITFWSRVEPSPRSRSIAEGVAAVVRDPLWMLTRQWQLGEFRGEDAASPSFAQLASRVNPLETWVAPGGEPQALPPNAPLEPAGLAEDFSQIDPALPDAAQVADLSLAVELGQVFERALRDRNRPDLLPRFRAVYRLEDDEPHLDEWDRDARHLLQAAAGRVTHGGRLHLAAERARPGLPAEPSLDPGDETEVRAALDHLRAWVRDTVGTIGQSDAQAWRPDRLEYDLAVRAHTPSGDRVVLQAHPDREGVCEAYAFDVHEQDPPESPAEAPAPRAINRSVIPGNVSFRGMPNPRWWTFESGLMNFGAVRPEKREVAKLVVLDFMLVHSNDWFVVPFRQPLGTLCRVDSLVVHDVFGGLTRVDRADRPPTSGGARWTMFSTSIAGTNDVADFFVVAATAGANTQSGAALEDVRFVRDEMANLAWGIESVVANGIGMPWPSNERTHEDVGTLPPAVPPAVDAPPLRYRVQTTAPEHWIPFVPVAVSTGNREIALERGVLLTDAGFTLARPAGRILRPTTAVEGRYRLREEEVPREGVRVTRSVRRARWTDGSTHVWVARAKTVHAREERSGLVFDVAETTLK